MLMASVRASARACTVIIYREHSDCNYADGETNTQSYAVQYFCTVVKIISLNKFKWILNLAKASAKLFLPTDLCKLSDVGESTQNIYRKILEFWLLTSYGRYLGKI